MKGGYHSAQNSPELGMTMKEAKSLLAATQQAMVVAQSQRIIDEASHCAGCGAPLKVKDRRQIVYRTLFGKVRLPSPLVQAHAVLDKAETCCSVSHDLVFSYVV